MPQLEPVPNVGSQIERAVRAWLVECGAGTNDEIFIANDQRDRPNKLIEVIAHKSTEAVPNSRIEAFMVRIKAQYPAADQAGNPNKDWNWWQVNRFIGIPMAAMSRTNNAGQDFHLTAVKLTIYGRRLAVIGTAHDKEVNADMATFFSNFVEFKGSQRAEQNNEGLAFCEIRNFEVRGCNRDDDSIFPALTFDNAHTLNWTFTLGGITRTEPAHWLVQKSSDSGGTWTNHAVLDAGARTQDISGQATKYWRVLRSNDGVAALDPESNLVKAIVA